jgi:NADPH:quinone reductase-like Zn-dependent oxidoreductase
MPLAGLPARGHAMGMNAIRMHRFGGRDVLVHEQIHDPQPGPGELRLTVAATGLNRVDADVREGRARFPVALPHVLGLEIVGRIDAAGPDVDPQWAVGDRVTPRMNAAGVTLGITAPGGYAERVVAPAAALVRVPDELSDVEAAALQLSFGTAYHALFARARLAAGETVLVSSVSGLVAGAAARLARRAGAIVIGTSSSAAKLAAADLDGRVDYTREDVGARVRELTGGHGVDVVFEHVGGEHFRTALAALAPDGRLVTIGAHAGEVVALDVLPFFRQEQTVLGSRGATHDELGEVFALAAAAEIRQEIAATFPLADAAAAMEMLERRDVTGKVVLTPATR